MSIFLKKILKIQPFISIFPHRFSFLKSFPISDFFQKKPEELKTMESNDYEFYDQDHQWFSRLKDSVLKKIGVSEKFESISYDKTLRKSHKFLNSSENFMDKINLIIFLGTSNERRVHIVKAQKITIQLIKDLRSDKNFQNYLISFGDKEADIKKLTPSESEFLRKLWPNLLLSMSNLQIFDEKLIKAFLVVFKHWETEIYKTYCFPNQTMLSLAWACINYEVSECEEVTLLKSSLLDYIWFNKENLDRIRLLRYVWLISMGYSNVNEKVELEAFTKLLDSYKEKEYFSYNYKNANNILQIFLNYYPEISQIFFKDSLKNIMDLEDSKKDNGFIDPIDELLAGLTENKYKQLFTRFYPLCYNSNLICQMNDSQKTKKSTYNESCVKGLPSFLFQKTNLLNKSHVFEENVCRTLNEIRKVKFRRNVRIGIYEIDILIEPDTILEINGDVHTIYLVDGGKVRKTPKLEIKLR